MLDWMFIVILALALLLFFVIMFFEKDIQTQWLIGLIIFDIALWWALASAQLEIEVPYEIYNASSDKIETGVHYVRSKTAPALTYVFSAPAVIMFIYLSYNIFMIILRFYKKYLGRGY